MIRGATMAPVGLLHPYTKNPRRGNVAAVAESLQVNGQYRPIVVREGTDEILAGNHTYLAAVQLGWKEVAVSYVTATDEEAARIVLVDNRTNDLAGYDDLALSELLASLPNLKGVGYDDADLAGLVDTLPAFTDVPEEIARLDRRRLAVCPSCGEEIEVTTYTEKRR